MKHILISKIIRGEYAVSPEDGKIIYELINQEIKNKNKVDLDFNGIDLMTTAFLNNAIGALYKNFNGDELNQYLSMSNISDSDLLLAKKAIERAKLTFTDETKKRIEEEFKDEQNH